MGINYPASPDAFTVPSLPENTPTSEAGTGTRNVVESIRDLGAAITAVETNTSLATHDHNGTAGISHGSKLLQTNTHQSPDTDSAPGSIHHTIDPTGASPNQAAAANHIHSYTSNTITNKPFIKCTSTSRPISPQLGDHIWEVDTNRWRVFAQFAGEQQAVQGVFSTDLFNRTSAANMGTSLWSQTYTNGATTHGIMATPTGSTLSWVAQGSAYNRCIARRINSADQHTLSTDQVISFNTTAHVQDRSNASASNPNANDAYFRMSDDGNTYIRAALTWWKGSDGAIMLTYTTTGPTGEQLIGQLAAEANTANIDWQLRLVGNQFSAYMGIEYVGTLAIPTAVMANVNKGWGIGMQAGDGGSVQSLPNEIDQVTIADATYFTSSAIWQLLPVGDVPRVALATTTTQAINPTGSVIQWGYVGEDNFSFFNSGTPTTIVCSEPGVYFIHASIAWGTNLLGDHAATVLTINDQTTPHLHWEFVRGFNFTPGFSQTVDVSAYVRLAGGDRVGVMAAHNGSASQFTGYLKGSSVLSQFSRFFMTFHSA